MHQMVQAALPCLCFARNGTAVPPPPWAPPGAGPGSRLELRGGTDAPMAPPIDYLRFVLVPLLQKRLGLTGLGIHLQRRGYYPKGGGHVSLHVPTLDSALPPLVMVERGQVVALRGYAYAAGAAWPPDTGARLLASARSALRDDAGAGLRCVPFLEDDARDGGATPSIGAGAGILLVAETSTGCLLGATAAAEVKGATPEQVGKAAAERLLAELATGACLDQHAADQVIIYMGLARGRSTVLIGHPTLHTTTAAWVQERFGVTFTFEPSPDVPGCTLMSCEGMGYSHPPGLSPG